MGMSRSLWRVAVAALFATVLQWTTLPVWARAPLVLSAWIAFALSCMGWLLAHTGWGQLLRSHRKATRPMVLLVIFMVGGCLTVATWLLVPKLTAEQPPLALEAKSPSPSPTPTATPSPLPSISQPLTPTTVPTPSRPRSPRKRNPTTTPDDGEAILLGKKKGSKVHK